MQLNKWFLMLLALAFFVGCTQQGTSASPPAVSTPPAVSPSPVPSPSPAPPDSLTPSPTPASGLQPLEIEMTAKRWEFQPATITVHRGQPVILHILSTDVAHGFAIPEFNVDERLEPGQTTTVSFTPDRTGTFTFFCSVFCGSGHTAMRGQLVVTD